MRFTHTSKTYPGWIMKTSLVGLGVVQVGERVRDASLTCHIQERIVLVPHQSLFGFYAPLGAFGTRFHPKRKFHCFHAPSRKVQIRQKDRVNDGCGQRGAFQQLLGPKKGKVLLHNQARIINAIPISTIKLIFWVLLKEDNNNLPTNMPDKVVATEGMVLRKPSGS